MSRKIVSVDSNKKIQYPDLRFELGKVLTEEKEFNGDKYLPGQLDPEFIPEIQTISLGNIQGRTYHSIHQNYTDEQLTPTNETDYKIESDLTEDHIFSFLKYNSEINQKYINDNSYLEFLGFSIKYDPSSDHKDLIIDPTPLIDRPDPLNIEPSQIENSNSGEITNAK